MRYALKSLVWILALTVWASIAQTAESGGLRLLRDAEIEGLLRIYSKPIFKAADLNPGAVKVYLIGDPRINAFVAGGQRIFINTGLLTRAATPNEVIGVLAHEAGHIAGGHLARLDSELARASKERIIGMLIGAAAAVGGAATGNEGATVLGRGVVLGSQGAAQRGLLAYQRSMEATADESALRYLNASGQSGRGMLTMFDRLAREMLVATRGADPYLFSHPMPFERIRTLEIAVKKSPHFNKRDSQGLQLRHELAQAKIIGYESQPQTVFRKYPKSDTSLPARYARAVSYYRRGDMREAIPLIDDLIKAIPDNPYFWELKAQAYVESGQPQKALAPAEQARKLLPNNGLIQLLHAQALVNIGTIEAADKSLSVLRLARKTEADTPTIFKFEAQAYATKRDVPRAELATAEYAWVTGDKTLAVEKAKRAQKFFKRGSREWLRASDIVTFATNK
jgi:predicted Zn-dependent protease